MQQSIQSFNIPPRAFHKHLIVLRAQPVWWEIWTLPRWGGEFEPEVLSIKSFQLYLLIWRYLKEKSWLLQADGSEEERSTLVQVLGFTK